MELDFHNSNVSNAAAVKDLFYLFIVDNKVRLSDFQLTKWFKEICYKGNRDLVKDL